MTVAQAVGASGRRRAITLRCVSARRKLIVVSNRGPVVVPATRTAIASRAGVAAGS